MSVLDTFMGFVSGNELAAIEAKIAGLRAYRDKLAREAGEAREIAGTIEARIPDAATDDEAQRLRRQMADALAQADACRARRRDVENQISALNSRRVEIEDVANAERRRSDAVIGQGVIAEMLPLVAALAELDRGTRRSQAAAWGAGTARSATGSLGADRRDVQLGTVGAAAAGVQTHRRHPCAGSHAR